MMTLAQRVHVGRRFQRSIRIDSDLNDPDALKGFICPKSSADVLLTMAKHIGDTGHAAFTWTGPYGSGKSSLVIALSGLLSANKTTSRAAAESVGKSTATTIWSALPPKTKGWTVVPVVGRRDIPSRVIGEALEDAQLGVPDSKGHWSEARVLSSLKDAANKHPRSEGGLILFIDEMGKFLEGAAQDGNDVYIFQQLAEAASRSNGRLIVVGILHQAFEEYAHRLSREARDEWSKVQGRFLDLAVNTAGEEQVDLLSRAIESDHRPKKPSALSEAVAVAVRSKRPSASQHLADALEGCWPLHPVVACLLGPISRRRFGQNQRSIFGFLNSAETHGFQDFLRDADGSTLYEPDRLWDYLRVNLEPAILASPDGHRWALAAEAVERCEGLGGEQLHIRLLKTIALIDLFKERAGLVPSVEVLCTCVPEASKKAVQNSLKQLVGWSLVIYRKFVDGYAIYAGSDFDIDLAVESTLEDIREIDFSALKNLAGLQPLLAKRHYHETGALRWFDVNLAPLNAVVETAAAYVPRNGTIGEFLLAIPTESEHEDIAQKICGEAARQSKDWDIVVGLSQRAWGITELARELLALQKVRDERAELAGDAVARREVEARLAALQGQLESELNRAFDTANWNVKKRQAKRWFQSELNALASELSDRRFPITPHLHNELLNRIKPSSNAVAAQNALLRRMVLNEGEARLGIKNFPAEGGLFASLLEATGLFQDTPEGWRFVSPSDERYKLQPLWQATIDFLERNADRTIPVSELYDLWREPPFGVKDGLMPILAVAFILSRRDTIALYRQGVFQAKFKDLDVDYLAKDAGDIQIRWMDLSEVSRKLLSHTAEVVRDLDHDNALTDLAPIDVARGLISIYDKLPLWTTRTMRLSANAAEVRDLFKHANDPNKFLFDDLPAALGLDADLIDDDAINRIVYAVRDGLNELTEAYPTMLRRLCDMMLAELQVPNLSQQSIAELRERADNISQLAGDFRLDAFASRLAQFSGSDTDIEGIAGLAANKPPRDWVDPDLDRAAIEITDLAQRFIRAETFARVKGRADKRHAMAVVVGIGGRPAPYLQEFDIADTDRELVDGLIAKVKETLDGAEPYQKNVILAALAELSVQYSDHVTDKTATGGKKVAS